MSGLKLFYWIGLSTNAGSGPNITPTFLCVSEFQGHLLLAVAALLVEALGGGAHWIYGSENVGQGKFWWCSC